MSVVSDDEEQAKVEAAWRELPDRYEIDVIDNGPGLPKQNRKKLLEPYVTTKVKGTGLGLAVVKKIADDHRARIDLKNLAEGGAQVSLSFQVADGQNRLI